MDFANEDVIPFVGDLTEFSENGPIPHGNPAIDVIFISNFLEHLSSKEEILSLIEQVKNLLRQHGKIIILQPNIKYVGGKYWDFFDHKTPLTDEALIELAHMLDLKVVKCVRKFLPYTTKGSLPTSAFLVRLYLLMMPVSGYVLGKQTYLVLEKK